MFKMVKGHSALLLEDGKKALLIADLHLGFEHELHQAGINVPPQSDRIFARLADLLEAHKPDALYIVGDLKHQVPRMSRVEWEDIPFFVEEAMQHVEQIHLVPGNHDGGIERVLPREVTRHSSKGVLIRNEEATALVHGHAWPGLDGLAADRLVMAHIHPVVQFESSIGFSIRRRAWIKHRCDRQILASKIAKTKKAKKAVKNILDEKSEELELVIMPAFNDFLSGVPVNASPEKSLLGPVLRSKAIDPDEGEVFLLDGTYLGKVRQLRPTLKRNL